MNHKRKIQECINTFQQQLKKIKDELPVYESDREKIEAIFEAVDNYDFSPKPKYVVYSGFCTRSFNEKSDSFSLPFSLHFEFEDEETFESIKKEYDHPVMIELFNKHILQNEECFLTDDKFYNIEDIDAEDTDDFPIHVSRKRIEKYNVKKEIQKK